MMKTTLYSLLFVGVVFTLGCGGGDDGNTDGGDSSTTSQGDATTSTPAEEEKEPEPPPPVPVKEKIVGIWEASLQLDNDTLQAGRDRLTEEADLEEYEKIVEDLIFSSAKLEFKDDGTVVVKWPRADEEVTGTYTVENDENTSALVTIKHPGADGEVEHKLTFTFEKDDNLKFPWNYGLPEKVQDVFHIEGHLRK